MNWRTIAHRAGCFVGATTARTSSSTECSRRLIAIVAISSILSLSNAVNNVLWGTIAQNF